MSLGPRRAFKLVQAGLLTFGSFYLPRLPGSENFKKSQWHIAVFVPDYSGGPAPDLNGVPYSAHGKAPEYFFYYKNSALKSTNNFKYFIGPNQGTFWVRGLRGEKYPGGFHQSAAGSRRLLPDFETSAPRWDFRN